MLAEEMRALQNGCCLRVKGMTGGDIGLESGKVHFSSKFMFYNSVDFFFFLREREKEGERKGVKH